MIYLDTSVALAQLLAEDRRPPDSFWSASFISSRLLEYELWVRIHARRLAASHGEAARDLLGRLALIELTPPVLARVLEPFPVPVRTLDALHLASLDFIARQGAKVALATYDERLLESARRLGIPTVEP